MSRQRLNSYSRRSLSVLPVALGCLWVLAGCGEFFGPESNDSSSEATVTQRQALTPLCTVNLQGVGVIPTETQYLERVIACENGNAPFEALKAQAIAARTYAKFKMETSGSLIDGQGDQVYSTGCSRQPNDEHRRAVNETRGQVLTHNGIVLAGFYVSGVNTDNASCRPSQSDIDSASAIDRDMENRFVTYNQGRSGNNVLPTRLGHPGNPRNRGCKSQNGASCLARQGRGHVEILKFYYGDDVQITQLGGDCGGAPVQQAPEDGSGTAANQGQAPTKTNTPESSCVVLEGDPRIEPRVAWNARAPREIRATHTPQRITIQHSLTGTGVTGPSAMREVQAWHMDSNNWADIGYHFGVARDGTIFEGNAVTRVGAHVLGQNENNIGIALIGNFDQETPSSAQINATAHLVRFLAREYGFEANRDNVKGANELISTQSPGRNVISQLDRLVSIAANATKTCNTPTPEEAAADPSRGALEPPQIPTTNGGTDGGFQSIPQGSATGSNQPAENPDGADYQFVRITNISATPAAIDGVGVATNGEALVAALVEAESGVTNARAATKILDVNSCAQLLTNAAIIAPGGSLTLNFFESFNKGDKVKVRRSISPLTDCPEDQTEDTLIKVEISVDGSSWSTLSDSSKTDTDFEAGAGMISMDGVPVPGEKASGGGGFLSKLLGGLSKILKIVGIVAKVAKLDIFSGLGKIGEIAGKVGSIAEKGIDFLNKGKQLITVIARDAQGNPLQAFSKLVDVGKDLALKTLKNGAVVNTLTKLQSVATAATKVVKYFSNGTLIGESTDAENDFGLNATLPEGNQTIEAKSFDANGNEIASESANVTVSEQGNGMRFEIPESGGVYQTSVTMAVQVSNPEVVKVKYIANPDFVLGEATNAPDQFIYSYTFNTPGERTITAQGFNAAGEQIDEVMIPVTIVSPQGVVPPPEAGQPADPAASPVSEVEIDTARANALAAAAARVDGRRSGGYCWRETYASMKRAGYTDAGFDVLAQAGPCSVGNFNGSAYCVGRNFAANPQFLKQHLNMTKIDVAPADAPVGALIVWDKGCNGYHAIHGHIEVKIEGGRACSDFCGTVATGGQSCANVFVPTLP